MLPLRTVSTAVNGLSDKEESVQELLAEAGRRAQILLAADALFAAAPDPCAVTMDDVADAAGVGMDTLAGRFGDRTGLVREVFELRLAPLRRTTMIGPPPLGPSTPARPRILALLDALLIAKLDNHHLALALGRSPRSGGGLASNRHYEAPHYVYFHRLLWEMVSALIGPRHAEWTAHALLAATRADLGERFVSTDDLQVRRMRGELAVYATNVLNAGAS